MQTISKFVSQTYGNISSAQRRSFISLFGLALIIAVMWQPAGKDSFIFSTPFSIEPVIEEGSTLNTSSDVADISDDQAVPSDEIPTDEISDITDKTDNSYTVVSGDSFIGILSQYAINSDDVLLLVGQYPKLSQLKAGQTLSWTLDQEGNLQSLILHQTKREVVVYNRTANGFSQSVEEREGVWVNSAVSGKINGSFITSAKQAGLTNSEINTIVKALQWQVDFRRLRSGDLFSVVVSREMIDGSRADSSILAVRLKTQGRDYYAILANNGQYYNNKGESLGRGFLRYPLHQKPRISSPFNPRRLHPITKKIAPHNGVDFAIPTGTPVLAPGDGEVVIAKRSGAAGNYIAIRHGNQYATRYMHLSKILVKPGQKVKRGDRIALSGNTGRSTGPHLHYEFHVNGKPVDPMKVSLPKAEGLTGNTLKTFLTQVKKFEPQLAF